jgi:hypothetical protein
MNSGVVATASGVQLPQPAEPRAELLVINRHLAVEYHRAGGELLDGRLDVRNRRVWSCPLRLTSRTRSRSL